MGIDEVESGPRMERTPHRVESLDFLRGVAILGVIAVHVGQTFKTGRGAVDGVISLGRFGVQLFFYVSAFTMCYMWERRRGERRPVLNFYLRRFFRIAPLYWIATAVYFFVNWQDVAWWGRAALLNACLFHGFSPRAINSVVPGGWSIAVEVTFYAIFPALILAVGRRRGVYLVLAVLVWAGYTMLVMGWLGRVILSRDPMLGTVQTRDFLYLNFLNQAPIFLLGCYLYFALNCEGRLRRVEIAGLAAWAACSIALGRVRHEGHYAFAAVYVGMAVAYFAVTKYKVKVRALEPLGRNSYAIYLGHFLVIDLLVRVFADRRGIGVLGIAIVVTTLLSYLISVATEELLESRVHRLVNAYTSRD